MRAGYEHADRKKRERAERRRPAPEIYPED